jgi:hypothetical protein
MILNHENQYGRSFADLTLTGKKSLISEYFISKYATPGPRRWLNLNLQ